MALTGKIDDAENIRPPEIYIKNAISIWHVLI